MFNILRRSEQPLADTRSITYINTISGPRAAKARKIVKAEFCYRFMDRSLIGQEAQKDPLQSTSSWDVPEQRSAEVADSAVGLQTLAMQVLDPAPPS